jgi:hypothetical protein
VPPFSICERTYVAMTEVGTVTVIADSPKLKTEGQKRWKGRKIEGPKDK